MFIKAKIAYDDGDRLSLINLNGDLIIRIDKDKTEDGRESLWVITGYDTKGVEKGYYITDISIKDMATFLKKHNLLIEVEKSSSNGV